MRLKNKIKTAALHTSLIPVVVLSFTACMPPHFADFDGKTIQGSMTPASTSAFFYDSAGEPFTANAQAVSITFFIGIINEPSLTIRFSQSQREIILPVSKEALETATLENEVDLPADVSGQKSVVKIIENAEQSSQRRELVKAHSFRWCGKVAVPITHYYIDTLAMVHRSLEVRFFKNSQVQATITANLGSKEELLIHRRVESDQYQHYHNNGVPEKPET